MGSTYLSLHYHLVFATKNREAIIMPEWRSRLYEYLGGTISGLGGFSREIGGLSDHIHLLVDLMATHSLSDVLGELKKASSVWVHEEIGLQAFAWPEGYAAFTVSAPSIPGVRKYIANQEKHHRNQSSRDELLNLLKKAEIKYNLQYFE